jgi:hypothetical protein
LVVHAVEVVAREDDDILHVFVLGVFQQPEVLANGVSGSFEPPLSAIARPLRGSQDLHVPVSEVATVSEVVSARDVAVERGGIELRQDVDLVNAAVNAVAHRHINQPVSTSKRNLAKNQNIISASWTLPKHGEWHQF